MFLIRDDKLYSDKVLTQKSMNERKENEGSSTLFPKDELLAFGFDVRSVIFCNSGPALF